MSGRARVAVVSLAYDVCVCLVAALLALEVRRGIMPNGATFSFHLDWSLLVIPVTVLATFWLHGLYQREVYLSHWIHLWLLVRAIVVAAVATAAILFAVHSSVDFGSRLVAGFSFAFLVVLLGVGRVVLLGSAVLRTLEPHAQTLLIGQGPALEGLSRRLQRVRGFNNLVELDVSARGRTALEGQALDLIKRSQSPADGPAQPIRTVIIDAAAMSPCAAVMVSQAAKGAGCEVYVASMLVRALASRRLLLELFQTPTVRVRTSFEHAVATPGKRVFDVAVATVLLAVLSPVFLVISLAIKLASRGPVLYAQERVGRDGAPFRFYKFRTMRAGDDHELHRHFVSRFIEGERVCGPAGGERGAADKSPSRFAAPFKIADDPRVTSVGRFLRKYSLDELPQLWNVVRGDMSLVGPRPPLPYEVEVYQPWHRLRLAPMPGVSGLWQVQGRSRVTFDEMVLQDVMYACNRNLLTDGVICLRTIPAAILGRGAA